MYEGGEGASLVVQHAGARDGGCAVGGAYFLDKTFLISF